MSSAPELCRTRARSLIHKYALAGTGWAALPLPVATSIGLTALETHLIWSIAKVYGESLSHPDAVVVAAGLEGASFGLKRVAHEAAGLVPVVGWGIKAAIAGSAIEALGALAIHHFESKYPNRVFAAS